MLKMYTNDGIWIIEDKGVNKCFESAYDAWCHVFLLREIRPKVDMGPRSLYPVRSLNPMPERRVKNVRLYT